MLAARYLGPDQLELVDVPKPTISDEEALVKVEACGFCGRDAVTTPPCLKSYSNDISRGEMWKHMTDEQKAMWNKKGNGVCK